MKVTAKADVKQAGEKLKDVLIQGPVYTQENVDDPSLQAQLWSK